MSKNKKDETIEKGERFGLDIAEIMSEYEGEDMGYITAFGLSIFARNFIDIHGITVFKEFIDFIIDRHKREEMK